MSDLSHTGSRSWAHACARHDCTNLGRAGETTGELLRRVADETPTDAVPQHSGRSRQDHSIAWATRVAFVSATAAAAEMAAARASGDAAAERERPVVVLHSGNNDLEYETAAAIAHTMHAVVRVIRARLPQARVLVLGLFASRRMKVGRRETIHRLNGHLREMAERFRDADAVQCPAGGQPVEPCPAAATPSRHPGVGSDGLASVTYVDLASALACRGFGAPDSLVPEEAMSDAIHLNALGCHALMLTVLASIASADVQDGDAEASLLEPPRLSEPRDGLAEVASSARPRRSKPGR
jgi:lysophospholipase L1-like esterase